MKNWFEELVEKTKSVPGWNTPEPPGKPGKKYAGGRTRDKLPVAMPQRKHSSPPAESMEIVQARTWQRLGKCLVRLEWCVWDDLYGKWRVVPKFNITIEQPSPARIHQMRWKLLNAVEQIRRENGKED